MTNNDILRQLRYIFDLNDEEMIAIFAAAEYETERWKISDWLKKDEEKQLNLNNSELNYFLDGLINHKRGKREGYEPTFQGKLSNNQVLRKLKIALNYKDIDLLDIFKSVGVNMSKHELSAFFRKPDKGQYQEMGNQYLRNFLHGLQLRLRTD